MLTAFKLGLAELQTIRGQIQFLAALLPSAVARAEDLAQLAAQAAAAAVVV